MARKSRVHLPGGYYHVMMRGNRGNDIFFSSADRTRFLFFLQEGIERYGHRVHAFCLMDNHVHLLIQVSSIPLSNIIQNLSFRYTRYINRQKRSVGHLFQGRYKAILVEADSYLLQLARYIHLNPVRAGTCATANAFEWSSHSAYTGKLMIPWLHTEEILSRFSTNSSRAVERYVDFVEEGIAEPKRLDFHQGSHQGRILGDDHFAERALHASDQTLVGKPPSLVTIIEAVAKEYNIEPASLSTPLKIRPQTEARAIVAMIVQETVGITLTSLAEELERDISSLSKSGERVRKRIKNNDLLQERVKRIMSEIIMPNSQS